LIGTPRRGSRFKVPGAPGEPPYFLTLEQPLVKVRGGAYLFQPGVHALRALARGSI
jgi:hypothetical protein